MPLFIPEDYTAKLAPETMEQAITYLKEIFGSSDISRDAAIMQCI